MKSFSGKAFEPSVEAIAAVSVYFAKWVALRIAKDEDLDVRVWDSAAMLSWPPTPTYLILP